ncbi:MAG: IS30 family transposase [Bryobacterales bacterium]|nr:IS30 family transposase [Bryobacterales bacterium]MDE0627309.1 IS30 family transposase [Bryobacterales bacterium]
MRKTKDLVGGALVSMLWPVSDLVLAVTADNGKKFGGHREVGADLYFARPYHSWERGLNEHTNGLIRQYFGKSESLANLDPQQVCKVADLLNGRPRKALGFRTLAEVFAAAGGPAATAGCRRDRDCLPQPVVN